MELHPILEHSASPNPGLWYVISAFGECPSERVGHTLSYIPGPQGHSGKLYVIGGANPSGPFNETFILDLDTFSWDIAEGSGLKSRYEHSAFVPMSQPKKIYIFGGADQSSNHNDIQVFDTETQTFSTKTPLGTPPSVRTYHNATAVGDKFIVYSGGQSGADPVGDRQVHCYNAKDNAWSILSVRGDSPKPRHGHLVVTAGNKVIIHGGMSGPTFYDDLHVLDLQKNTWSSVKQKKVYPSARAGHSGVVMGNDLYVFGGMNREGALDDLYKLDTDTLKWTRMQVEGTPPPSRLDFAMCAVRLRVPLTAPSLDEMLSSGIQAKEVLDTQLRMGSAGSVRSVGSSVGSPGSAGSQRSLSSLTAISTLTEDMVVTGEGVKPSQMSELAQEENPQDQASAANGFRESQEDSVQYKLIDLALIFGGMDTEGNIFDDCLVLLIKEEELERNNVASATGVENNSQKSQE